MELCGRFASFHQRFVLAIILKLLLPAEQLGET
jgi:hypothetical protein